MPAHAIHGVRPVFWAGNGAVHGPGAHLSLTGTGDPGSGLRPARLYGLACSFASNVIYRSDDDLHIVTVMAIERLSAISYNYAARGRRARDHRDHRDAGMRRLADRPVRRSFTRR